MDIFEFLQSPAFQAKSLETQQSIRQNLWEQYQQRPDFPTDPGAQADVQARVLGAPMLKERPDAPLPLPGLPGDLNWAAGKVAGQMRPGGLLSAPNVGSLVGGIAGMALPLPPPLGPLVGAGVGAGVGRAGEILKRRLYGTSSEPEPQTLPTPPVVNPPWPEELRSLNEAAGVGILQEAMGQAGGAVSQKALRTGVPGITKWYKAQAPMRAVAQRHGITELPLSVQTESPVAAQFGTIEKHIPMGTGAARESEKVLRSQVQGAVAGMGTTAAGGVPAGMEVAGQAVKRQVGDKAVRLQSAMSQTALKAAGGALPDEQLLGTAAQQRVAALRAQGKQAAQGMTGAIGPPAPLGPAGLGMRTAREKGMKAAKIIYGKPFQELEEELVGTPISVSSTSALQDDIATVGNAVGAFQTMPEKKLASTTLVPPEAATGQGIDTGTGDAGICG